MNILIRLLTFIGLTSSAVAADIALKEGDCWSYSSRPGEEQSFLVIRKIESLPKQGEVIHISVFGLKIKNPGAPGGYTDHAAHLPITGASVRRSIKQTVRKDVPDSDWTEGYRLWREAYDSGRGGVFTTPVSECIGFVETAMNQGKKG